MNKYKKINIDIFDTLYKINTEGVGYSVSRYVATSKGSGTKLIE